MNSVLYRYVRAMTRTSQDQFYTSAKYAYTLKVATNWHCIRIGYVILFLKNGVFLNFVPSLWAVAQAVICDITMRWEWSNQDHLEDLNQIKAHKIAFRHNTSLVTILVSLLVCLIEFALSSKLEQSTTRCNKSCHAVHVHSCGSYFIHGNKDHLFPAASVSRHPRNFATSRRYFYFYIHADVYLHKLHK